MTTTGIRAEQILRELDELWVSLSKGGSEATASGVLRACSMTLLVGVDAAHQDPALGETLAALMPEHPSRLILLRVGAAELGAHVTAQCWMPFGRRQQICAEQVEIDIPADRVAEVLPVLRGLLAPDLPVVLWARDQRLLDASFSGIAELAQKLIVDSTGCEDPLALLARLRELSRDRLVADLNWTRVTRWREAVARLFDNPCCASAASQIRHAEITHTSAAPHVRSLYLARWLRAALGSETKVTYRRSPEPAPWELQRVELLGAENEISITRRDLSTVEWRWSGTTACAHFPVLQEYELLREELGILTRDPWFERVVAAT